MQERIMDGNGMQVKEIPIVEGNSDREITIAIEECDKLIDEE
jgi:hypothetical protein